MLWQVDFYVDENGRAPVEEFLTDLPMAHRAKLLATIKLLEWKGPNRPFPYSSQVRGKLRELRSQQGRDRLRVLYFGDARRVFILLHGIVKRSAQLPAEDIQVAERRMQKHTRREGKGAK
jgi:phage-related protein